VEGATVPDEAYDEVEFTMVGGQTFRMRTSVGEGRVLLADTYEQTWQAIDDATRIRMDKVVSIKLYAHDDEAPQIL
jgi:hypothetical protein